VRNIIILALLSLTLCANAQQPISNPQIKNNNFPSSPSSLDDVRPVTFEDYLVQLAWQNSFELEGSRYEIDSRGHEITLAKKDWTRNLQTGINVNDVSFPYFLVNTLGVTTWFGKPIAVDKIPTVASYPMFNIGAGVNFGDLMMRKSKVKVAENKKKMSEADMNFKKQKLKGEVLKRYQEYLSSFDIFKVRIQALDAAESNKNQIQSLFSVNKVQFEDYNTANKAYYDALENKVKGEAEIKLKRIALEELIGSKWESVEKVKSNYEENKKKG
jgi:hypothetical protein